MDVVDADQARVAEEAGAVAVMALERVPADIRAQGGVARMSDPAMIRTKGEAGTGDIVNAVTHMRAVFGHIRRLTSLAEEELYAEAKHLQAPLELVRWVAEHGRLPVVTFTAGGIATPADASLCMQLGADGVFVGSGIFKSGDPERRAKALVEATTHFQDAEILARVSAGLGEPMVGISTQSLDPGELLETRGW
jgi:pyridoxal 5'-phosphate synthase pdxS subunit